MVKGSVVVRRVEEVAEPAQMEEGRKDTGWQVNHLHLQIQIPRMIVFELCSLCTQNPLFLGRISLLKVESP